MTVDETIKERAKVYGAVHHSHKNIGLAWTALIQQHYGIELSHPLSETLVQLMMVSFKVQRSCRVYHLDNYIDLKAYAQFAEHSQANPGVPYELNGLPNAMVNIGVDLAKGKDETVYPEPRSRERVTCQGCGIEVTKVTLPYDPVCPICSNPL